MQRILSHYNRLMLLIARLAKRDQDDLIILESKRYFYLCCMVGIAIGLFFLITLIYALIPEFDRSPNLDVSLKITPNSWKIYYGDNEAHCADVVEEVHCLAHPNNPQLWNSPDLRSDDDAPQRIRSQQGRKFWLGVDIPISLVKEAEAQRANHLILGYFGAGYRIWVNGKLRMEGHPYEDRIPTILNLDFGDFKGHDSMRIAIQLSYDTQALFPLGMNNYNEFFANKTENHRYLLSRTLRTEISPAIIGTLNLAALLIFLVFWIYAPSKYEYIWLALFCGIEMFSQYLGTIFVNRHFGYDLMWRLSCLKYFYKGFFGLLLGLSYARVKVRLLYTVAIMAICLPPIPAIFIESTEVIGKLTHLVAVYFVTSCYAIAAILALSQRSFLIATTSKNTFQFRKRMLLIFSLGVAVMIVMSLASSVYIFSEYYSSYANYANAAVVFALCIVIVIDFRSQVEDGRVQLALTQKLTQELERDKAIANTAYMVAHDLARPLNLMKRFIAEVGVKNLPNEFKQPLSPFVAQVNASISSVENMLGEILEFGKKKSVNLENKISLMSVIAESIALLSPSSKEASFDIKVEIGHNKLVRGSHQDLIRVTSNLLENAIKAMPNAGHIKISTVADEDVEENVDVHIFNSGSFLTNEQITNIFKPFQRYGSYEGSGLGLSICKKIIESHRGNIKCQSTAEIGTTFSYSVLASNEFDLAPRPPERVTVAANTRPNLPKDNLRNTSASVVLIEDDPFIVDAWSKMHSKNISIYQSASDFINCHQGPCEIVVTDLFLPGISTFDQINDFLSKIRLEYGDTKIFLCSDFNPKGYALIDRNLYHAILAKRAYSLEELRNLAQ